MLCRERGKSWTCTLERLELYLVWEPSIRHPNRVVDVVRCCGSLGAMLLCCLSSGQWKLKDFSGIMRASWDMDKLFPLVVGNFEKWVMEEEEEKNCSWKTKENKLNKTKISQGCEKICLEEVVLLLMVCATAWPSLWWPGDRVQSCSLSGQRDIQVMLFHHRLVEFVS